MQRDCRHALLLLDAEEPFTRREVRKLRDDVSRRGLGLLVASDWFNPRIIAELSYVDEAIGETKTCGAGGGCPAFADGIDQFRLWRE